MEIENSKQNKKQNKNRNSYGNLTVKTWKPKYSLYSLGIICSITISFFYSVNKITEKSLKLIQATYMKLQWHFFKKFGPTQSWEIRNFWLNPVLVGWWYYGFRCCLEYNERMQTSRMTSVSWSIFEKNEEMISYFSSFFFVFQL